MVKQQPANKLRVYQVTLDSLQYAYIVRRHHVFITQQYKRVERDLEVY